MILQCKLCGLEPHELKSVNKFAKENGMTPEEFVRELEGTYNKETELFYCDDCYIKLGMPLGKA